MTIHVRIYSLRAHVRGDPCFPASERGSSIKSKYSFYVYSDILGRCVLTPGDGEHFQTAYGQTLCYIKAFVSKHSRHE